MKSASNGGILSGSLQMLHIHILFVAPVGVGHMAQPGTDQHEGRIAVWETTHHTGTAADLPVQPFNDIVCTDAGSVFAGEIAIGKHLLNASSTFLAASFGFVARSSSTTALAFSRAAFLLSWAWVALSILATSFRTSSGP